MTSNNLCNLSIRVGKNDPIVSIEAWHKILHRLAESLFARLC